MGLLDGLFEAIGEVVSLQRDQDQREQRRDAIAGPPDFDDEDLQEFKQLSTEEQLQRLREEGGTDSAVQELLEFTFGGTFDTLEDAIDDELTEGDLSDLDQAEQNINDAEGVALSEAIALIGSQTAIEAVSAGQVDSFETPLAEVLSFLALDDIVGTRLGVTMEQAVLPSLEAEVAKQNRTQFASLNDAVELALRNKQADSGYLSPENSPQRVQDLIGSDDPVNPDNLVEEWGIRDDNLDILEEVALEQIEFEELIETPAELGLVVPEDVLEQELDRVGYSEDLKEFLMQVSDALPRSARTYQELLTSEEYVRALDTLAESGVVDPADAEDMIPDEVPAEAGAFEERFQLLRDLPAGAPSGTDFEGAFASGYLSLDELRDRLDQTDYPTDQYEPVLRKQVLDELDGDLQEAVGLGLLSEAEFSDLAEFAGLDDETTELLLQGQSVSDITTERLAQQAAPDERSVGTIVGIGESRARALDAAGVETVADLAQADPETVAEAAQVSPETAEEFISQAQQREN